jgi:hypothetical protein
MLVLGPLEYAESESVFIFWLSGAKVQIFAFWSAGLWGPVRDLGAINTLTILIQGHGGQCILNILSQGLKGPKTGSLGRNTSSRMIKIGHRRLISAFSVLNPFFHTLEKPTLWSKIHLTGRSDGFSNVGSGTFGVRWIRICVHILAIWSQSSNIRVLKCGTLGTSQGLRGHKYANYPNPGTWGVSVF